VGIAKVLEEVVVALQHVLLHHTHRGVGVLRSEPQVVVIVKQVLHCNSDKTFIPGDSFVP
jgi:hypothetical protein